MKVSRLTNKKYYECHITLCGRPSEIKPDVELHNWKFSAIDGDIDLGEGVKCYATRHYNATKLTNEEVLDELTEMADRLSLCKHKVLRKKIELVIYDERLD